MSERVRAARARLAAIVADPRVTDVFVDGPGPVTVDRGTAVERVEIGLDSTTTVRELATSLADEAGRRLDNARPWVDAALPGSVRLHAVLDPIAVAGPYLSLRRHRAESLDLDALAASGTLSAESARIVRAIVGARLPFLVTGGAGSGKTTLLGAMLSHADRRERILVVEDTPELVVDHPNAITMATRDANVENAGAVTMRDLVRQAMRMRPDRIVVGECRGAEVLDLLTAFNTGHDGGAGTLHCNGPADVPSRIIALTGGHGVPPATVAALLRSAVRVVLHMRRAGDRRAVDEIGVLDPKRDGVVTSAWTVDGGAGPGAVALSRLLGHAEAADR